MWYWVLVCFVAAAVAGVLGFGGWAGTLAWVAQWLFLVFVLMLAVSLMVVIVRRPPSPARPRPGTGRRRAGDRSTVYHGPM